MTLSAGPIASGLGLRVSVFPCAADPDRLRSFCDEWFNATVPPEVAVFKPAAPLVLCTAIRYPEMEDELVWRTGVQTQNELYFLVPLERHRVEGGRERFVEYGVTTPYVFVDNATSVVAGREQFGFPKQDCRFDNGAGDNVPLPWVEDDERYLAMSTWEPTPLGHRQRELIRIVRPSHARGSWPVVDVRAALRSLRAAAVAFTSSLAAAAGAGWAGVVQILEALRGGGPVTSYNLRQFADPEHKEAARYQDLVRFSMRVREVYRGGRLNGLGPFRIEVQRVDVTPIVRRLGLRRVDGRAVDGADELEPVAPFYSRTDVDLVECERLCWRDDCSGWRTDDGRPIGRAAAGRARYNDHLGPSAAAFLETQPRAPVLDMKMMMLAARTSAVAEHVATIVPAIPGLALRPIECDGWTALRVMVSRSRKPPDADAEELVWLDGAYLSFAVPVELRIGEACSDAMLLLLDFTDNGFLLQAMRELALAPTRLGNFDTEPGDWFASTQPATRLLRIESLALQRSAASAKLVTSPVVDVFAVRQAPARPTELPIDALWSTIDRSRPVIAFGTVPHVDPARGPVARRLLRTRYVDVESTAGNDGIAAPLFVQLHESESFPLFADLGFAEVSPDGAMGRLVRTPGSGRTRIVPAIRSLDFAARVELRSMDVVWQDHGATSPRRPR